MHRSKSKSDNKIKPYIIQSDSEKSSKFKKQNHTQGIFAITGYFSGFVTCNKKSERIII